MQADEIRVWLPAREQLYEHDTEAEDIGRLTILGVREYCITPLVSIMCLCCYSLIYLLVCIPSGAQ